MAYNYLEDHALKNVWCAPAQDRQSIVQAARVTPQGGVWNQVTVMWRTHILPLTGVRFHVYMIGGLHPALLGLFLSKHKWETFTDCCNKMTMIVDLYVDSGVELPRFEAWYKVDADGNLLMAVKDPQPTIDVDLNTQPLYLRVYSNAFYQSLRGQAQNGTIVMNGARPLSTDDILALQNEFESYAGMPGKAYAFVNGFKVSGIDLFTVHVGDAAEYIYDASIYKVVDFSIADLRTFDSLLDLKTKYLLHYPGLGDSQIDYQDDIDVFLAKPTGVSSNRFQGVYVHRNAPDMLRMVTHKDYSITVPYLVALAAYQPTWTDPNALMLRLHIRYGGWDRGLVFENNRIQELYKMADTDIRGAMLGIDSTVSNWRADTLEDSPYCLLMREPVPCLPEDVVEAAYGYNAISKLLGDTPEIVTNMEGQPAIAVPYALQTNAWGYEYDVNGQLLGYFAHSGGSVYPTKDSRATRVEMIAGIGSTDLDETYGLQTQSIDLTADYRMYTCPIVNGLPNNVWTDVTGSSNYAIIGNQLTWTVNLATTYTLVRSNKSFLAYTLELPAPEGVLEFSLQSRQRRNGLISTWVMQIPCGELVLHLNDHPIIQGLDYFVQFPVINIVNKAYLVGDPATTAQTIDIRFTGHCHSDFSFETTEDDYGFVQDGMLSVDNKYDLRDDKVLRITAGGAFYDRTQLSFAETGQVVVPANLPDGSPYLVRDIVVPTRGLTIEDTYTLRANSLAIDTAVSAYLTSKLPQPPLPTPVVIPALYRLFSPFICKIIYDLKSGVLDDPRLYQQYGSALVLELCKPYEPLLAFDPSQEALRPDPNYVIVDPHNLMTVIEVTIYQYKFLVGVVKQYMGGQVVLSGHLSIANALAA